MAVHVTLPVARGEVGIVREEFVDCVHLPQTILRRLVCIDRTDDEGKAQREAEDEVEHERDDAGRDEDAWDGECDERPEHAADVPPLERVGGLEHEARHEHEQDEQRLSL